MLQDAPLSCAGGDAPRPGHTRLLLAPRPRWRRSPPPPTCASWAIHRSRRAPGRAGGRWYSTTGRLSARQHETGIEYGGSYVVRGDVLSATFDQCPMPECGVILEMRCSVHRYLVPRNAGYLPGRPFSGIGIATPWERVR